MSLFDDWNSQDGKGNVGNYSGRQTQRRTDLNPFAEEQPPKEKAGPIAKSVNPFVEESQPGKNPFGESGESLKQNADQKKMAVPPPSSGEVPKLQGSNSALSMSSLFSGQVGDDIFDDDLDDELESDETKPSFFVEPVNWTQGYPNSSPGNVKSMWVGGGSALLLLASSNGQEQLWLWELVGGGRKLPVSVQSMDSKKNPIHKAAICPIGCHVFISLENGENYYLNIKAAGSSSSSLRARGPIQRLKDVVIESVAWDKKNESEDTTGDILLGTAKGGIWEVSIESTRLKDKKQIKKVYQLNMPIPVCGLEMFRVSGTESKWFVMAATAKPTRFYEFVGGPNIEAMFKAYVAPENQSFRELPGDIDHSQLFCFTKTVRSTPETFMLLSEAGLYIGNLDLSSDDKIASRHNMVYFASKTKSSGETLANPPLSALETDFHYVLLYPSWLIVLSKLNESIVFEQRLDTIQNGSTLGLAFDEMKRTMWLFTKQHIFRLVIRNEDGNVWRLFLDMAHGGDPTKFDTALSMCKSDSQRDKVLTLRADFHFSIGEYEKAAEFFSQTKRSFEEVALMFIDKSRREALRIYLLRKLSALPTSSKTQRTIIAVWLVELYLEKVNDSESGVERLTVEKVFHKFLAEYSDILRPAKDTIYKLMASHGRDPDYLAFALINGDFERVVVRYIQRNMHERAIESLANQTRRLNKNNLEPSGNFVELYYKYSPELMEHCPRSTVDAWIEASFLDPCMLIPSLVRYSQSHASKVLLQSSEEDEAVRYLEHCINVQGNQDEAIHNLLVAMYAARQDDTNLREFIQSPSACFDLKYALRVCSEHHQKHACVDIYSAMGLYSEAVELALDIDVELAKDKANASMTSDPQQRRKLWLRIAEHEINQLSQGGSTNPKAVIQQALSILRERNALMIEDILPFLPDVVVVGDLKDEICHSLEQYNQEIEQLKNEMNEQTETAESIRKEIDQQQDHFMIVFPDYKCDLCGLHVVQEPFYVFPCTHAFHSQCLLEELSRHLGPDQAEKVEMLRSVIEHQQGSRDRPDPGQSTASESYCDLDDDEEDDDAENELFTSGKLQPFQPLEGTKAEREKLAMLDDFVAAACPFCGDLMIQSIAEPFVTQQERQDAKEWEI